MMSIEKLIICLKCLWSFRSRRKDTRERSESDAQNPSPSATMDDSVTSAPPRPSPLDLVDQPPSDLIDDSPLSHKEIGELINHSLRSPIPLACLPEELQEAFNDLILLVENITEDIYCPDREYEREQFFERRRQEIWWGLKEKFGYSGWENELEEAVDEDMEALLEDFEDDFDDFFSSLQYEYETEITWKVADCILRLKRDIKRYPILARVINKDRLPLLIIIFVKWSGSFDDDHNDDSNSNSGGFFGSVDALREATKFLIRYNPFVIYYSLQIRDWEGGTFLHDLCKILTPRDIEVIGVVIYSIVEIHHPSLLMMCNGKGKTPLLVLCKKLHHWIRDGERGAESCSQMLVLISTMMERCPQSTRVMSKSGSRALDKLMPHSNVPAVQDLIIFMNRCLYPLLPFVSDGFTTEVQSSLNEEARHSKIGTRLMAMKTILSKRTMLFEADESSPTPEPADEVCEVLGDWVQLQLSKIDQKIKTIQDVDIPRIKKKYAA